MNVVDILISIVVVTILVTIILAIVTYVAYKLRLSREPEAKEDDPSSLRYFTPYEPPAEEVGGEDAAARASEGDTDEGPVPVGAEVGASDATPAEGSREPVGAGAGSRAGAHGSGGATAATDNASAGPSGAGDESALDRLERDIADLEGHASST